jgi:hypothetical protein
MKTSSIDEVITKVASRPKSLKEATSASGLPREPVLYAWWTAPGLIAFVSRAPLADIERWKARMGWETPWYTSRHPV